MKLTGTIKMTKRDWLVLDLLAILLVIGSLIAIVAVWSGAWWPFSSLEFPEWPFLAYLIWFLAAGGALTLVGVQLQWNSAQQAAAARQQAAVVEPPSPASVAPAPHEAGVRLPAISQPVSTDVPSQEHESVEAEPELAGAGR